MTRLAIIGPGLLGGSIALAARRAGGFHVRVWARRDAAATELLQRGIAEIASTDLSLVVRDADLVVLAVPIGAMAELSRRLVSMIPSGTVVTDVGSVKAPVVRELTAIFGERGRFVGSHPMAGSELSGLDAAQAGLFDGAACIVTPDTLSNAAAVSAVHEFWRSWLW
jgi:prephenate dehydrogenase